MFSSSSFSTEAFSTDSWLFDVTTEEHQIIRNFDNDYNWARVHRREKETEEIIWLVALRQSESLLTDEQKIYDELSRELTLKGLEFEARHLEALNLQREALIDAEIGKLLKNKVREDEEVLMMFATMVSQRII